MSSRPRPQRLGQPVVRVRVNIRPQLVRGDAVEHSRAQGNNVFRRYALDQPGGDRLLVDADHGAGGCLGVEVVDNSLQSTHTATINHFKWSVQPLFSVWMLTR